MKHCRSCGAGILWAVSAASGQRMPLDAEPVAGGNVKLTAGDPPLAHVVGATIDLLDPDDDGVRYMPHHATCPDVERWRSQAAKQKRLR